MRCALVNVGTGQVENLIVADPAVDTVPDGYILIAAPDFVEIGAPWDGVAFVDPHVGLTSPAPIDGLDTI